MNETPERICEALEWLTGHKWTESWLKHGKPSFACDDGDQTFCWDSGDGYCLHRGWFKRNIEEELAHALEVTAPWGWMDCETGVFLAQIRGDLAVQVKHNKTVADSWKVTTPDGVTHSGIAQSVDAAKTAARAAYLTWMRGRFAMKGGAV